jgi:hypothetical protein
MSATDGAAEGPLTGGQAALVDAAIKNSNAAAVQTPSAASGQHTTADTLLDIINAAMKGLPIISATATDIETIEQGAKATLHWWGWTVELTNDGSKALDKLFNNDLGGLSAILAALTPISAPLAAVAAILGAITTGLSAWIETENKGNGVTLKGYLWIGVDVTSN